jgi:hypothetical protein
MSIQRTRSKGSSGSRSKHIPTPPPLPPVRSANMSKSHTLKNKTQTFHSGATIAYDGAGRVVWLKDVETGKIYFNRNNPLTLTPSEIKAIEQKNASKLGIKYGGKRTRKHRRKHKRKHY